MKKIFFIILCACLTSCHALVVADHLTFAGGVAKKPQSITVTDTLVTSEIAPE